MVNTISSVVDGRRLASVAHIAGATASAALMGLVLGGLGSFFVAPWGDLGVIALAVVAALYLAHDAVGVPVPVPQRRAQVPQWWRTFYPAPVTTAMYGAMLGVGFITHLRFGTLVIACVGAAAVGDPILGAAICAPFGFARAITAVTNADPKANLEQLEAIGAGPYPRGLAVATALATLVIALVAL